MFRAGYEPQIVAARPALENSMANVCQTLDDVNRMDQRSFVLHFGGVYEHSPWVAQLAWNHRPFGSIEAIHAAMDSVLLAAPVEKQTRLIRAHPELAGRLARLGKLTSASRSEQSQAGLDRLREDQITELNQLNAEYLQKFEFPFIICARLNDADSIVKAMRARLASRPKTEFQTALQEISKIARLRLADLVR
jgi:2-oxo-4-hydroxy-4-carboxy-5-ureidoimidazoline decarboxylase